VVLFAAFTVWELRTPDPFVDVRLPATAGALTRTYVRYALDPFTLADAWNAMAGHVVGRARLDGTYEIG
jgi:hypothetical protein